MHNKATICEVLPWRFIHQQRLRIRLFPKSETFAGISSSSACLFFLANSVLPGTPWHISFLRPPRPISALREMQQMDATKIARRLRSTRVSSSPLLLRNGIYPAKACGWPASHSP